MQGRDVSSFWPNCRGSSCREHLKGHKLVVAAHKRQGGWFATWIMASGRPAEPRNVKNSYTKSILFLNIVCACGSIKV